MSYQIYYDRAFIRVGDKFIPIINSGSNNCWQYYNRREVPEKSWNVLNWKRDYQFLFSESEIKDIARDYELNNQKSGMDFKSRNRCFENGEFERWIINGIKNAYTIEEYVSFGNRFFVLDYSPAETEKWKKHSLKTTTELLKILEEPPKHVVFILNTCFPVKLLKTTLSRCVLIKTDEPFESEPLSITDYDDNDYTGLTIEFFTAIEKGNQAIVELMFKLDKMTKAQFYDFISSARNEIIKKLRSPNINEINISNKNLVSADTLLVKAYDFLDQNVNVGHISGYICANLIDTTDE